MNRIVWSIGVDGPIVPSGPLPPRPEIPPGSIVTIEGRAPIWRYGRAFHALHGAASVVCTRDPRLGDVVIASHHPDYQEGQILPVTS